MNKNEEQLKIIGNKSDTKLQINLFDEYLSTKAVALLNRLATEILKWSFLKYSSRTTRGPIYQNFSLIE